MKYIILVLAFAAAQAIATGKHGPKDGGPRTPDIKTPPTKPEPKAQPSTPRAPQSRDEGQRDTSPLCSRWPTMLFCDRP